METRFIGSNYARSLLWIPTIIGALDFFSIRL